MRGASWRAIGPAAVVLIAAAALIPGIPSAEAAPPVFTFFQPDGGDVYPGASSLAIAWNATHDADAWLNATIRLSLDGGTTYPFFIAAGTFPAGYAQQHWAVPRVNATTARIRVCLTAPDASFGCRESMSDFTIQTSPPYLDVLNPAWDRSPPLETLGVPVTEPLAIVVSNDIDQATVRVTVAPPLGFSATWSGNIWWLTHVAPFQACTQYSVSASGTDVFGGRHISNASFWTECPYPFLLLTQPADGDTQVDPWTPMTVWFSDPMNDSATSFTITQGIPPVTPIWVEWYTEAILNSSYPLPACRLITIQVTGLDVHGRALGQAGATNPWSFVTACPGVNVSLTSPTGGEDWTGGSVHQITWTQSSPTGSALDWRLEWTPGTGSQTWPDLPVTTYPYPGGDYATYLYNAPDKLRTDVPPNMVSATWTASFYNGYNVDYGIFYDADCNGTYAVTDLYSGFAMATNANPETFTAVFPPAGCYWVHIAGYDAFTGQTTTTITLDFGGWWPIANGTAGNGSQRFDWTVPSANVTTARVRACVGTPPSECDVSGNFTIDSSAPTLVSHDPPDGALDVLLTMFLTANFSEPMDAAKAEAAFWTSPPGFVMGRSWPAPNVLVLQIEGLRTATRYIWGFACTATDRSSPGNPLANCTASHSFTTEGGVPPPTVSLTSPLGGESWTGGSAHPVRFTVDNTGPVTETFTVTAAYRYAGGSLGGSIGTLPLTVPAGTPMDGEIPWTVPGIDALDVIVNVTATNRTGATFGDESGPFEIDSTAPTVTGVLPAVVQPADPITVVFTEAMARLATQSAVAITPDPGGLTFGWGPGSTALTIGHAPFVLCTMYTLTVGTAARDDSDPGNPIPASFTRSFRVVCSPSVDLLAPDGGEDWTGGSVHDLRWTTSDPDDATLTITLSYSLDGGADGFPHIISSGLVVPTGTGSLPWTLPTVDAGEVLVRVDVVDAAGNTATDTSAAVFTIDSTPPALLVSFPADGATGHKTTRAIWFVWTERVDRASFVAAFSLAPDPGGLSYIWSVGNLGGDVLLVDHRAFASRTPYTATFAVTAKDDSDPGNALAASVVVRFSTQPPPNVNPPVAKAVGQHQVEAGVPTTFDGSASTGDIRDYVWRIADNQGGFVAVLVGVRPTYTFDAHGRYSVTLFVTDANGTSDDDTIEIAVTSNPNSESLLAAGAAGAALLVAALIGATEVGRLAAFSLVLFPLYARRKKDEPAEQETRGMIRGYVLVHPGDSYTDIKRNLGLGNGTLTYHLTVLEREGIVRSQVRGSRKLFFPREARLPEDGGGLHEVQLRMLRAIQAIPGLAVTDLAGALGITSQLALYHLRDLAAKGRIRFERRGLRLRCFAEDSSPAPMD